MRVWLPILLVITSAAAFTFTAGCEDARGSIRGIVYDEEGVPAADLPLRASHPGLPAALLRTGPDGRYEIQDVPTGEWTIEFFNSGGWLVGQKTVTVRGSEIVALDFVHGEEPLLQGTTPYRISGVP